MPELSADHDRLDALRRVAKDRAATPAEKATARRLAKALAAKIGKTSPSEPAQEPCCGPARATGGGMAAAADHLA